MTQPSATTDPAHLDCPACLGDGLTRDADGGPCVTCATPLRVVVCDGVAYCEEAAG